MILCIWNQFNIQKLLKRLFFVVSGKGRPLLQLLNKKLIPSEVVLLFVQKYEFYRHNFNN